MRYLPLLLLSAVLGGCASSSSMPTTADGRRWSDLEAAPYRLAMAPVAIDEAALERGRSEGLELPWSGAELQQRLVEVLRDQNAATEVHAVTADRDLEEASEMYADLLLRPRLTSVRLEPAGYADSAAVSGILWITTWIGGLLIGDSRYVAQLHLEWDVINPHTHSRVAAFSTSSHEADLSYLDRHDFWSLRTLQSFVLPPFWSFDDDDGTSEALMEHACLKVGSEVTAYLKGRLGGDERELLGACKVVRPRNGSVVSSNVELAGTITARDAVTEVLVLHDGHDEPILELDMNALPNRAEQMVGSFFEVDLPSIPMQLDPGTNRVTIEYVVAGRRTSRTLVWQCEEEGRS